MTSKQSKSEPKRIMAPRTVTRREAFALLIAGAGALIAGTPNVSSAVEFSASQETLDALADAQEQAAAAEARLEELSEQYEYAVSELNGTLDQIEEVNGQIASTEAQIETKNEEIATTEAKIEEEQNECEAKQEQLGKRMTSAYKSGPARFLEILLSATSFDELTSNIYYLDKVSEADELMIAEIKEIKAWLEDLRTQLEAAKVALEEQKAQLENWKAQLEALKAQQQEQLSNLQATQAEVSELLNGLNEEVQSLIAQRDAEILAAKQEYERQEAERKAREEAERKAAEEAARQQQQGGSESGSNSGGSSNSGSSSGGTGSAQAVINACYSTPSTGSGMCAAWVTNVFIRAGIGSWSGNACDMYYSWCGSSNRADLQPGMIIAVGSCPGSYASRLYGHVGIYIGNGLVYHNLSGVVGTMSLDTWCSTLGTTSTPRWGWLGGKVLS